MALRVVNLQLIQFRRDDIDLPCLDVYVVLLRMPSHLFILADEMKGFKVFESQNVYTSGL